MKPDKPKLYGIVAMAENNVIGLHNQLPWHLPADLQHFKTLTTDNIIIMGRKTHESIGKALPQRINIILTRDKHYQAPGCQVFHAIEDAIATNMHLNKKFFIIGGAKIYQQLLPQISKLYLTHIKQTFVGDCYFPKLNPKEWQEIERIDHLPSAENAYPYSFLILQRI